MIYLNSLFVVFRSKNNILLNFFLILTPLIISSPGRLEAEIYKEKSTNEEVAKEITKSQVTYQYILGAGDQISIIYNNLEEFNQIHTVGPTGAIYLPEIGEFQVEGLSVDGLKQKLKEGYKDILYNPEFTIQIVSYRAVNAYILGEVRNPGKYTISETDLSDFNLRSESLKGFNKKSAKDLSGYPQKDIIGFTRNLRSNSFPTLFDAIRASGGITEKSDLTSIEISRKIPTDRGGGYIRAKLNILPEVIGSMVTESQNIKILDGDIIKVNKSENSIAKQMRVAMKSNINPYQILVFISGQAVTSGNKIMPNGSSLNQLISSSGGKKLFSGNIEFIRFENNGLVDRRIFKYNPNKLDGDYMNPILRDGDIVHIQRSLVGYGTEVVSTITKPAVGIFTLYNIFY